MRKSSYDSRSVYGPEPAEEPLPVTVKGIGIEVGISLENRPADFAPPFTTSLPSLRYPSFARLTGCAIAEMERVMPTRLGLGFDRLSFPRRRSRLQGAARDQLSSASGGAGPEG